MIKDLIKAKDILIVENNPKNVDDAINLTTSLLLQQGKINPSYPEAIIALHHNIGPYYVLAPKIAMPHARPEDGVNELCLQLTVFRQGMDFGSKDNGLVYFSISLAALDGDSHIQTIMILSEFFQNDEDIEGIINGSAAEILQIIQKY